MVSVGSLFCPPCHHPPEKTFDVYGDVKELIRERLLCFALEGRFGLNVPLSTILCQKPRRFRIAAAIASYLRYHEVPLPSGGSTFCLGRDPTAEATRFRVSGARRDSARRSCHGGTVTAP